jgi:hypothetical protein
MSSDSPLKIGPRCASSGAGRPAARGTTTHASASAQTNFADLLSAALGKAASRLHPDIRARFAASGAGRRSSFSGRMQQVDRSIPGWCVALLLRPLRVLPSCRAYAVPFEFHLEPASAGSWVKRRVYGFRDGPFEFSSVMKLDRDGRLVEQFPLGFGMRVRLEAAGDALWFRDDGYFFRWGGYRLDFPRWLGVGRFELLHRNIDSERFDVEIRIRHFLFGPLFYQTGRFRGGSPTVSAHVSAPTGALLVNRAD